MNRRIVSCPALLLIIGFAGAAVFGFMLMSVAMMMNHNLCVASLINGVPCFSEGNILNVASFHLNAFYSISSALVEIFAVAIFAAVLLFFRKGTGLFSSEDKITAFTSRRFLSKFKAPSLLDFQNWLAFQKNSPNF